MKLSKKRKQELLDAYNEGKTIQIKYVFSLLIKSKTKFYWKDIIGRPILSNNCEYRIKPKDDVNGDRSVDDVKNNGLK